MFVPNPIQQMRNKQAKRTAALKALFAFYPTSILVLHQPAGVWSRDLYISDVIDEATRIVR